MKFKTIIWDWNGTLLDDTRLCGVIINQLLTERQLPTLSTDEHRKLFDFPVKLFYERAGFDLEKEGFETVSSQFIGRYYEEMEGCGLHDGALEVLSFFRERGIRQMVLSASERNYLKASLERHGVLEYMDVVLGIESIHAPGKRDIAREWLRSNQIPTEDLLLIGDTIHDFEIGQLLGVKTILMRHGNHHPERLKDCECEQFDDFGALQARLNSGW